MSMKDIVYSILKFLWIANVGSDAGGIVILFCLFDSSMVFGKIYFQFSLASITSSFLPEAFGFAADQCECSQGWSVPLVGRLMIGFGDEWIMFVEELRECGVITPEKVLEAS